MKLDDRIALVTGGGSGIGRAIALLFSEEGAQVVVNDIRLDAARETVAAMGGRRGRAVQADVADSTQVRAMFGEIARDLGRLDILVNNAGIGETSPGEVEGLTAKIEARIGEMMSAGPIQTHWDLTQNLSDEAWHRMIGVHLNGTFFCTREALRLMSPRNRGVIVNISSVAGLAGVEIAPHYGAAKGGILSFTRSVAREMASRNIRVNAICPGWIDTPMTRPLTPMMKMLATSQIPLRRFADPREVATTALFLASDDSSYVTGQWLSPAGGLFTG
jgi:3-oxoacyl-[acyl-carrier protein] reductase